MAIQALGHFLLDHIPALLPSVGYSDAPSILICAMWTAATYIKVDHKDMAIENVHMVCRYSMRLVANITVLIKSLIHRFLGNSCYISGREVIVPLFWTAIFKGKYNGIIWQLCGKA